jgi:hypothetical protein
VSWNGHYLIGYVVAIAITALITTGSLALCTGTRWVTWTKRAECATATTSSQTRAGCPKAASTPATATVSLAAAPATVALSPCQQLQEALLHPDMAGTSNSMIAIAGDINTNDIARGLAQDYLGIDKANPSAQQKEIPIIQSLCNL